MNPYLDTKNPPPQVLEAFLSNPVDHKNRRLNVIYWTTFNENGKVVGRHRKRLEGFDYQYKEDMVVEENVKPGLITE